uniref:Uncharacterized protein n=1 Tax=Eptatretus burgeri TaxID=7764 RepID=A0A8C4NHF7_EPTBU
MVCSLYFDLLCMLSGTYGLAVTFCSQGEEESQLKSISSRCGLQLWPLPDPLSAEVMADVLSTQEVDDVLPCSGAAWAIEKAQPSRQSPSAAHRINDATGKKATIGQSTLQTVPRACLPSNTDRCTSLNIQALPLNGKNKSRKVIKASPEKQEELADKEASVWQTEHQKRGLDVKQAEVVEPKQLPNNRYAFVKGGLGKNNENILKRESDKIHLQIPLFSSFKNNLELRSIPFEEFENNYKNFLQDETQALAYSLEDFKQTSQMSESSIDTESSEESSSVMEEELLSADAAGRSESEMLSNISPADVVEVDKTGSDSVCNAHDSHSGDRLESESPESTTVTSDSHWKMRIHSKSFQGKKMASKLHQNLRYVRGRDSFPIWHPSGAHAHWRETAQCDTANDRMCHSRTYFHENWYSAWARASLASSVYLWELQK